MKYLDTNKIMVTTFQIITSSKIKAILGVNESELQIVAIAISMVVFAESRKCTFSNSLPYLRYYLSIRHSDSIEKSLDSHYNIFFYKCAKYCELKKNKTNLIQSCKEFSIFRSQVPGKQNTLYVNGESNPSSFIYE